MTKTLTDLENRVDQATAAFDDACRLHYCDGRRGYFRAWQCGQHVPASLHKACDQYLAAHADYYAARDGARGFWGSKGL